jgi:hypothetical protein
LPDDVTIWAFQSLLKEALRYYALQRPLATQFYFVPQTDALDRWYDRMSLSFCRPGATPADGLIFRKISSPIDGEGGFYGYQRL